jgi:hypothetical protein
MVVVLVLRDGALLFFDGIPGAYLALWINFAPVIYLDDNLN